MKTVFIFLSIFCLGLVGCSLIFAQNMNFSPPSMTEPSPEAFGFGKYGFLETNLYTGSPDISIPLYDLEFEGLKIPLKLRYYMPGLKPNEEATWCGLGWTINSHASITRRVYGTDDFLVSDQGFKYGWIYTEPFLTTSRPSAVGSGAWILPTDTESKVLSHPGGGCLIPDLEQDHFVLNLFGETFRFVLDKHHAPNTWVKGICLNDQTIKIKVHEQNKNIVIYDGDGFKYTFNEKLRSKLLPGGCGFDQIMTWNLSKITSPGGVDLDFSYLFPQNFDIISTKSRIDIASDAYCHYGSMFNAPSVPSPITFNNYTISKENYLVSIKSPHLEILFLTSNRKDLNSPTSYPQRLEKIEIYHRYYDSNEWTKELKKSIHFKTSYFRSDKLSASDKDKYLRLKLDAIKINDLVYNFEYEEGQLPHKETLSIDYWGYYNGRSQNHLRPPFSVQSSSTCSGGALSGEKREANPQFSKFGVLKKITYPSSAYTHFEYEAHQVRMEDSKVYHWENNPSMLPAGSNRNKTVGGLRIKFLSDFSSINILNSKKEYIYELESSNVSSGKLMMEDINFVSYHRAYKCNSTLLCGGVEYFTVSSEPHSPLRSISGGAHLGYDRVEERTLNINNANYLSRILEFTNEVNVQGIAYSMNNCQKSPKLPNIYYRVTTAQSKSNRQYSRSFKNGSVSKEKIYNENGDLELEKIYSYQTDIQGFSTNVSLSLGAGCNPTAKSVDVFNVYSHDIVRYLKTSELVKAYFDSDHLEFISNYEYDNKWRIQAINTINPNDLLRHEVYYLDDYNAGVIPNDYFLNSKNVVNKVIKKRELSNGYLTSAKINRYDINGRLIAQYSARVNPLFTAPGHNSNVEIPNFYKKDFELSYYGDRINIKEYKPEKALPKTYIWGYKNSEILAVIEGLEYDQVISIYNLDRDLLLRTKDENLRRNELLNLKNALDIEGVSVKIMDYNPKVGMTWIKNESGQEKEYRFNPQNRLKHIINHQNQSFIGFKYNYSNKNF